MSGPGSKAPTPAADKRSKFLQTCNRFSLFLKQNGNIPHPNLTINPNYSSSHTTETSPVTQATTMGLLSNIQEDPDPDPAGEKLSPDIINLPHQYFILESSSNQVQNSTNKAAATSCSKPVKEPKTAQMTIFYRGQVLVLDDVSADRARDLMLMTNKLARHDKKNIHESHHVELAKKDSDLPIARRASLHKFLAKRKDREPHNHCPGAGASSSSASGKEHSFDLNM